MLSIPMFAQDVASSWKELDEQGTQLFNEARYEEALEVFVKAVAAAKKEFGVNDVNYAWTVQSVAVLQLYTARYEESERSFLEAMDIHQRLAGKNNAEYESYLNGIVSLYLTVGNAAKALKYYEESVVISKAVYGINSDEYLNTLKGLADQYMDNGNMVRAEKLLLEGKGLAVGKDNLYGDYCTRLFQLFAEQGNDVKAEPYFVEAKKIRNKSQQEFWKTVDFKSMTYSYQIDDQDARLEYWSGQAEEFKEQDSTSIMYARALLNLFLIYQTQEDFTRSEQTLMAAKAIIEKSGTIYDYSGLYNSLASFYDNLGNADLAKKFYGEQRKVARMANGRDHINYGTACQNQSIYLSKHKDNKNAELLAKTAVLVFAGLQDGFTYYSAACMSLAILSEKKGDMATAEAYQQEAANIQRMAFGENHYVYASSALSLGLLYEKQKKVSQAEALISDARQINEKVFGKDHIQYAGYTYELARFYVRQQNYAKAAPLFREAATIKLNRVRDNFNNLSEKEKKELYRSGEFYFENYAFCLLKLYEKDKTVARDLYQLIIDTKGLIYQSAARTRAKVLASGDQELIELFQEWTALREELAKAYSMALDERKTKGVNLTQLETNANALEKDLVRQASALKIEGLEEKKDIDWQQLKRKLKPDEALVEIVRAARDGMREEVIYGALILTGQEQAKPELILLGNGYALESKSINYYNNAIRFKLNDTLSYATFWKPLVTKLKGVQKIYFSPGGVYHQLSIASLKNPSTGKFVMEEYDVQVLGHTKDIVKEHKATRFSNETYLFGFPEYSSYELPQVNTQAKDSTRSFQPWSQLAKNRTRYFDASSGKVMPLPGTRNEVKAIEEMLKRKNIPVHVWMEKEASEEQLKKIQQPAILHIATHGFFLPNQYVTAQEGEEVQKAKQDPMLRSGLLLADCESTLRGESGSSKKEDGILSAYEAMNLPLDNTDLVVLSACETGVGEIDNNEGVYGLLRAFQQAGARFILVSLWKVDDEATQLLMTSFYQFQVNGDDYNEAFKKARTVVSKKYPSPYYWGAFVLIGI